MAVSAGRSPSWVYVAMAAIAVAVFLAVSAIPEPDPTGPGPDTSLPVVSDTPAPSLERDFLTTVLGRPRASDAHPYCDRRGCCPTWRTTFGTTAPTAEVIAAFEVQGYLARPGDRDIVRPGPFPHVRWTAELDYFGRWKWRRVEVTRGPDVDRPDWPTVFVQSSIACNAHRQDR
jgi:hypothetical protein